MLDLLLKRTVHTHTTPSPRVCAVAAMFGLGIADDRPIDIVPPTRLTLRPGQVLLITGASGGGKSTLLRLIADAAAAEQAHVVTLGTGALPDRPLVDLLPDRDLSAVLRLYARAGLSDAFVLLRRPAQLSDGQLARLRLALALAEAPPPTENALTVILADEFGATLDRVTARVLARNVRKWVSATRACFVAATTHEDLLEPLAPDLVIEKGLGSRIAIAEAPPRDPAAPADPTPCEQ
jgi:hypothetical protein